jgi:FkbM family methyltransferase
MNIIQIGANRANDDVTPVVNHHSSILNKFIAVEPLTVHHSAIKECYKHIPQLIIEGVAITPTPAQESLSFYYHKEDGPKYEVASTEKSHILKHVIYNPKLTEDGLVELEVDCLTLNQLFDKHELTTVDMLYIDAEGLDFELIKSIDFSKFSIVNIIYEHLHIDGEEAIKFLESKGYSTIRNCGHNGWSHAAIKKSIENENT